jgi:hypothetical protein
MAPMQKRIWQATLFLTISLFVASGTLQAQPYVMVTDDGFSFTPDPVYIVAGEVVYWIDDGTGPYTIYSNNGDWVPFATPGGLYFDQPGTYAYYDDAGDFGTVYVSANTPPSVTITNPTNNAVFTAPASFTFAADASDSDADGLSDVEFYVGTDLVDDVFSSPFATSVTDLTAGSYTLTVIAYDNVGATATNSITITVSSISINLTAPRISAGQFLFNVTGLTVGKTNVLQTSTNLLSWKPTQTNIAVSTSIMITNGPASGSHFYRILQMP